MFRFCQMPLACCHAAAICLRHVFIMRHILLLCCCRFAAIAAAADYAIFFAYHGIDAILR